MAVSVSNLTGGPAEFHLDDVRLSHTQGGIAFKCSPKQRMRVVDQYGSTPVDCIHTGDEVRVTAPMAEWTAALLAELYSPGNDQTAASTGSKYLGIGRSAGFIYTGGDVKVIPLLSANTAKKAQFYKCVQVGELEIMHNVEDDRVFKTEWAALGTPETSPGTTDGQIVGKIFLT